MPISKRILVPSIKEEFDSSLQANITFLCESLEIAALQSEPKWRITRRVDLSKGRAQSLVIGKRLFDQICDDRETLFPASPFVNTISTLFDGVDGEARTGLDPTALKFERTQPFSLSFIVKTPTPGTFMALIDKQKSTDNFKGWGTSVTSNKIRFVLRNSSAGGGNALIVDSLSSIATSAFEHWVITYVGGSAPADVTFYKNGAVDSGRTTIENTLTATTLSDERLRIGRRSGSSIPLNGNIDQPTVWNKALSAVEAAEAFNIDFLNRADIETHSAAANIISHWRMGDRKLFPLIPDQVGSDDLTIINMDSSSFVEDVA